MLNGQKSDSRDNLYLKSLFKFKNTTNAYYLNYFQSTICYYRVKI